MSDAVVLLSGGLDSYTAAAIARADGFRLCALTIRYGQRHAKELEAARAVALDLLGEEAVGHGHGGAADEAQAVEGANSGPKARKKRLT